MGEEITASRSLNKSTLLWSTHIHFTCGLKVKLTTHLHIVTTLRMLQVYLHHPLCLHSLSI